MASDSADLQRLVVSLEAQTTKFERALSRASDQADKSMRLIESATKRPTGAVDAMGAALDRTLSTARRGHEGLSQAVNDNARAFGSHRDMMNRSRMASLEMMHISKSLFDQLAAGASPMRAIALEGGRIAEVFSMGGVGGVLSNVKGLIGRLTTGWVGLGVGVAGASALVIGSLASWRSAQDELSASLETTGRRSGMTLAQLNSLAAAGARASGISVGTANGLVTGFAHAGFSADVTGSLVNSSRAYARVTVSKAGEQLTGIFSDPEKGMGELNKTFRLLDDRLSQTVKDLVAGGEIDAARRALSEALNQALAQTTDRTWTLSRAFSDATSGVGNLFNAMGSKIDHLVNGSTSAEKAVTAQAEVDRIKGEIAAAQRGGAIHTGFSTQVASAFSPGGVPSALQNELAKAMSKLADAQTAMAAEQTAADAAKKEADARALSLRAGDVTRGFLPDLAREQDLASKIKFLSDALGNPAVTAHLGVPVGAGQQALSNAQNIQFFNQPTRKAEQDAQLNLASIAAYSAGERAAVEADRARLAVLRETGDATKAAMAAEIARNEVIIRENKEAEDALDLARQSTKLIGLNPFEKGLQEIRDRFEGDGGLISKGSAEGRNQSLLRAPSTPDSALDAFRDMSTKGGQLIDPLHVLAGPGSPYGALMLPDRTASADSAAATSNADVKPTAERDYGVAEGVEIQNFIRSKIVEPFNAAKQSIADTQSQTALLTSTFGRSKAEIAGATEAEKLRQTYIHDGILSDKTSADTLAILNKNIADIGSSATAAASALEKAKAAQQQSIASADKFRTDLSDLISSPLIAFANHKDAKQALLQTAVGIGNGMIKQEVSGLVGTAFGKQGTPLGGLLGGGSVASAVINAGSVVVNGGIGAGTGAAAGGGLFGAIGSLFGGGGAGATAAAGDAVGKSGDVLASSFHTGGTVGLGVSSRSVSASVFSGAQRFHTGLNPGEMPAILQEGERVLTQAQASRSDSVIGGLASTAGASRAAPPINQHFYLDGAITSSDIESMAREAAARGIKSYDASLMSNINQKRARSPTGQ